MIVWRGIKTAFGWVKAIVLFLVNFVIGDDWTVAAAIAAGLVVTWRLVEADIPAWWLMPLVMLAATVQSLYRAVLRERG
jgi:hypothetical protein